MSKRNSTTTQISNAVVAPNEGRATQMFLAIYNTSVLAGEVNDLAVALRTIIVLMCYRLAVMVSDKSVQRTPLGKHLSDLQAICDSVFYTMLARYGYSTAVKRLGRKTSQFYNLDKGYLQNTSTAGNKYTKYSKIGTALGYINALEKACESTGTLLACFATMPTSVGVLVSQIITDQSDLKQSLQQALSKGGALESYKAWPVVQQYTKKPAEPAKDAPADAMIQYKPALAELMNQINSMPQKEYMTALAYIKKCPTLLSYMKETAAKLGN